jgi:hypothetical protein
VFLATCPAKDGEAPEGWWQEAFGLDRLEALIARARELGEIRGRRNVYVSVCSFRAPDGAAVRRVAAHAHQAHVVWLDFDTVPPEPAALAPLPHPTLIICTSAERAHWYWRLDAPLAAADAAALVGRLQRARRARDRRRRRHQGRRARPAPRGDH